jgi:hypothetical protein
MNFETHYLSHCRVIPLQSFGNHIRPQPHGLGYEIVQKRNCVLRIAYCKLRFAFVVQLF